MNVNLLPQENIQNRAPFMAGLLILIVILIGGVLLFISAFINQSLIRSKQEERDLQRIVLAKETGEITRLKQAQASLMQDKLTEVRSTSYRIAPLLREIDQRVGKNNLSVLSYTLGVVENSTGNEAETAESQTDGMEKTMPVTLNAEGLLLTEVGGTLDELSGIEWVESAFFKTLAVEEKEDNLKVANVTYLMNIVPERLAIRGGGS